MSKTQVVLILGSFNPVTTAHIAMGSCAKEVYSIADVVYIPVNQKYLQSFKGYSEMDIVSDEHRWKMLVGSLPRGCKASAVEMLGRVDGKTYNTARHFANLYDEVIVCIGADNLKDIDSWYRAEELVQSCKFLVFQRNGCESELAPKLQRYASNFVYLQAELPDVSSTQVRHALREGDNHLVKRSVPPYTYWYFTQHPELYKEVYT